MTGSTKSPTEGYDRDECLVCGERLVNGECLFCQEDERRTRRPPVREPKEVTKNAPRRRARETDS